MNRISTRIQALRSQMAKYGIDIYLIPSDDFHQSEYVGDYFKAREYITGFTGSAGTAIVTMDEVHLWTDGRYFVQAEQEIQGTGIILERMGVSGVPTVREFVESHLGGEMVLGFDGRCVGAYEALEYAKIADKREAYLATEKDLIGEIWEDRPRISAEPTWVLENKYAGEYVLDKLARVRETMTNMGADCHLLSSLTDIAYLLNMRGNDIECVPVFLAYLLIDTDETILFANSKNWSEAVLKHLADNNISLIDYDEVYSYIGSGNIKGKRLLINNFTVNYRLLTAIPSEIKVISGMNPSMNMKAVKNEVEISNTRQAHYYDGIAVTKFIYWLKKAIATGQRDLTEVSVADYLESLRRKMPGYIELSFDTIAAYGANAAMMHYSATKDSFAVLKPEGMLLVDSGAHYLTGTTDITRTIVLGPVTEEIKKNFTLVLKGHLRLLSAKFLSGSYGVSMDILARGPLWDEGKDYRCGTGHGVGHILSVHEGPNAFRYKLREGEKPTAIVPGMITTDEPGYYEDGSYGIRIESELLCIEDCETAYGKYYSFENLTYAPIDLEAVNVHELSDEEIKSLNNYHENVYNKLAGGLTDDERSWLYSVTRPVGKEYFGL